MPLQESDVLNTLSDSVTLNMNFWVAAVHIDGRSYGIIRDHIRAGNILVVEGNETLAKYDQKTDILKTQIGNSPANLFQRALLLHECTNALIDLFTNGTKVTRHTDELASYIAQFVYTIRSSPTIQVGPGNTPWDRFYQSVDGLVRRFKLDSALGNGSRIGAADLEPSRLLLTALPGVNYGDFKKDDPTGADGLIRNHLFLEIHEPISARYAVTANESYPDPSDEYLIRSLQQRYLASDVAGYGKRLRELRYDFALFSLARAKQLYARLVARKRGDSVSELFYDRLSTEGRALLLRILRDRV